MAESTSTSAGGDGNRRLRQQLEERVVTCGVCFALYDASCRVPRTLPPCGHVFCEPCLREVARVAAPHALCCPACRAPVAAGLRALPRAWPVLAVLTALGISDGAGDDGNSGDEMELELEPPAPTAASVCGPPWPGAIHFLTHCERGHAPVRYNATANRPGSWFSVDLGPRHVLRVAAVWLKHGNPWAGHRLNHWCLQGSNDGGNEWETISEQRAPRSSASVFAATPFASALVVTGPGAGGGAAYRLLRLLQLGPNTGGTHHLYCCGIELYGELRDLQRDEVVELPASDGGGGAVL
jgi:hypothetical protein